MRTNLITRLKEEWNNLDPVDPLRGLIADAIDALAEQPAQQQEPWGACVSGRVFVGRLPEHARKLSEDEGVPIQWLYTSPQPKPWVGLTEQEEKPNELLR